MIFIKSCILIKTSKIYKAGVILDFWIDQYAEGLKNLGYEVHIYENYEPETWKDILSSNTLSECKFILTFCNRFIIPFIDNKNIFERVGIPLISLYIEHIENSPGEIADTIQNTYIGLYDKQDIYFAKKYLNPNNNYFFAPNPGFKLNSAPPIHINQREIDVIFAGYITGDLIHLEFINSLESKTHKSLFFNMTDIMLSDEKMTAFSAFEYLTENYLEYQIFETPPYELIKHASFYARGKRRSNMLKGLQKHGIRMFILGKNSRTSELDQSLITTHDEVSPAEFIRYIASSKIVLNTSPFVGFASTERLTTAMLNGSIVATDTNPYISKYCFDSENCITYSHTNYDELAEKIKASLENKNHLERMSSYAEYTATNNFSIEIILSHMLRELGLE